MIFSICSSCLCILSHWLNEGHTLGKVWKDISIKFSKQAFLSGLSLKLTSWLRCISWRHVKIKSVKKKGKKSPNFER